MKLHKLVKQNGKRCLYNNWGKAIAIVMLNIGVRLFFTLLELILSMLLGEPQLNVGVENFSLGTLPRTTLLSMLMSCILTMGYFLLHEPFEMGISRWYYGLSNGQSPEVLEIFHYYSGKKLFFRSLVLQIHVWGRRLLWAIPYFALPAAVLAFSIWSLAYGHHYMDYDLSAIVGIVGLFLCFFLAVLCGIFYGIAMQKYFLARYYMIEQNCGPWEALKKSRHACKGKRWEIFRFKLSFLPWHLLSVLVVPALYVLPYYNISAMLYARVLMEQHYRSTQLVPVEPKQETEAELADTQIFDAVNTNEEEATNG